MSPAAAGHTSIANCVWQPRHSPRHRLPTFRKAAGRCAPRAAGSGARFHRQAHGTAANSGQHTTLPTSTAQRSI